MQDCAHSHFSIVVCEWLNDHFPWRWVGLDLTSCDFFLWGWLKEQVFSTTPATLEELER